MNYFLITTVFITLTAFVMAQVPQGISHQAVIRNAANELVTNSPIGIKVSILQGSAEGTVVYSETHLPISNSSGLISFVIGQGTVVNGVFAEIDWASGSYSIKTEADPSGGTSYTITGTSQVFCVPYALYAETAKKVEGNVAANVFPPSVVATSASNIESFSATLNGTVNAEGFSSTVIFEWGVTAAYGNTINSIQNLVTGSADVMVSANLSGLQSATTYHYRIRANNAVNVSYSNDMLFTTGISAPQLTTNTITNILAFSATGGGYISHDGGIPVTARGVAWSTSINPTLDDDFTEDGTGSGSFISEMTGLTHATTYYVRAYAINDIGITYGNQMSFTTQNGIVSLSTNVVTDVTANSATSGGNITDDGGAFIIVRGVVYSLNPEPTLADNHTEDGNGMGPFISTITGLTVNNYYYFRAYATNGAGTFYGNEFKFFTFNCGNLLTDLDYNTYNTVIIGNQCWMKENLKTTKYSNNTDIQWFSNINWSYSHIFGVYTWYNDDINWKDSYGALYNWYAVNHTNGLCPTGWHVPTDAEYTNLTEYLGDTNVAGGKMKSTRTEPDPHPRWDIYNYGATNESNWTGLPGGDCNPGGYCEDMGVYGYWWSSSEDSASHAWLRGLTNITAIVYRENRNKNFGFSVRCLRD